MEEVFYRVERIYSGKRGVHFHGLFNLVVTGDPFPQRGGDSGLPGKVVKEVWGGRELTKKKEFNK